jgi:isoleucyl-tRNA synthetase
LLGNLYDFAPDLHAVADADLLELDRWAMSKLRDLDHRALQAYAACEFHVVYRALVDYVAVDLSALYLDVVKDRLYSDAADSASRRSAQTVLYNVARSLAQLSAPILCFTAEDIWSHLPRRKDDPPTVHLCDMPEGRAAEADPQWETLLRYRDGAYKQIEAFRAQKNKSTDAHVVITPAAADRALLAGKLDLLADLLIVSLVSLAGDDAGEPGFEVQTAPGERCARCWKRYKTMSERHPDLCDRCSDVVAALHT